MAYIWTAAFETGNEETDKVHQELFSLMNRLMEASSIGQGGSQISEILKFLNNYVMTDFQKEEVRMADSDYPDYFLHKKAHSSFQKIVHSIEKEYQDTGANTSLIAKLCSVISFWLTNHIQRDDLMFAYYLHTRSA